LVSRERDFQFLFVSGVDVEPRDRGRLRIRSSAANEDAQNPGEDKEDEDLRMGGGSRASQPGTEPK